MEPFIGEIKMVGFNFAPTGYALCNGQIMSIAQNSALFSLLGTAFGGNGQTTFGLPDLRGRVPMHWGQGPGLTPYLWGQQAGSESVTLTSVQLPPHAHTFAVPGVTAPGNTSNVGTGQVLAGVNSTVKPYSTSNPDTTLKPGITGATGASQPVSVMQPYLSVTFIIATEGIFPSRP